MKQRQGLDTTGLMPMSGPIRRLEWRLCACRISRKGLLCYVLQGRDLSSLESVHAALGA